MLAVAGAVDAYCGGSCVRIREQSNGTLVLNLLFLSSTVFIADF